MGTLCRWRTAPRADGEALPAEAGLGRVVEVTTDGGFCGNAEDRSFKQGEYGLSSIIETKIARDLAMLFQQHLLPGKVANCQLGEAV